MCLTIQAKIPTIKGSHSAFSLKQREARGGGRRSDGMRGRERTDLKRKHASNSEMAHRVPLLTAQNVMSKNRNAPGIAHALPHYPTASVRSPATASNGRRSHVLR